MNEIQALRHDAIGSITRRHFLRNCVSGLGGAAMTYLLGCDYGHQGVRGAGATTGRTAAHTAHFPASAKRVIFLHMAGAPSQLELFDFKPELASLHGKDCPQSFLEGKRFAFIQGTPKMLGPQAQFQRHGESGTYVSDRLPYFSQVIDEVALLKAMYTHEFNHAPAQLLLHSGSPRLGRPGMGAWVTYGLGTENQNLPGYVVLVSGGKTPSAGKSVWGSGFLPSVYQGVQCRSEGDPVLFVSDPAGISRDLRRKTIDAINDINQQNYEAIGDPEIRTRMAQYEMAFKMQVSVPDVMDISEEPESMQALYGTEPGRTSFANNCLLARRLVERGVRFVQLFHWGWDSHGNGELESLHHGFVKRCKEVDQPMTALIRDLKQRGLLDETLIVWGGEFGRTPMRENRSGKEMAYLGRDHHNDAFAMWLAGGGVRGGISHGETDAFGYFGIEGRTHVHDLQATILHLLGMDHEKLTYHYQGRDFRLTDVHGNVIREILS
jgi:hypothetical protein